MRYTSKSGKVYDFDKCSKKDLAAYCWKAMTADDAIDPYTRLSEGALLLSVAEVTPEKKEDVARIMVQYLEALAQTPESVITEHTCQELKAITDRYRLADAPKEQDNAQKKGEKR